MSLPAAKYDQSDPLGAEKITDEVVDQQDETHSSVVTVRNHPSKQHKEDNDSSHDSQRKDMSHLEGVTVRENVIISTAPPPNDDKDMTLYSGDREVIFIGARSLLRS